MSILIKDMTMPKSCWECRFNASTIDHREACLLTKKTYNWGLTTPPGDCPLIEIPTHGRLNVIEPYMQHDEDDGFDELIKPSDIDYMHTPSVEEIIEGNGFDSFIKHFED